MASLQLVSGHYHICFRFNGHRFKRSLKTARLEHADSRRVRLEETIRLVETGRIEIPNDAADIGAFLLADGKVKRKKSAEQPVVPTPLLSLTLKSAFDEFFDAIPAGNLENSTLALMHIHERHLLKVIGLAFPLPSLTVETLQNYVNKRCKE